MPVKMQKPSAGSAVAIGTAQAVAHEETQVKKSGVEEAVEGKTYGVGDPLTLKAPLARVTVEAGAVIPTGNYRNVRVGVQLQVPCPMGEVDDTFEAAREWVDARMAEMMKEVDEAQG